MLCLAALFCFLTGCREHKDYSDYLLKAGANASQINIAIQYFNKDSNSSRLDLFNKQLEKIARNFTIRYVLTSDLGKAYTLTENIMIDSLEKWRRVPGNHLQMDTMWDIESIPGEFIIKNIEGAYYARTSYSWASKVNDDRFSKYVIPYRLGNERFGNWRSFNIGKYDSYIRDVVRVNYDTLKALRVYFQGELAPVEGITEQWIKKRYSYIDVLYTPDPDSLLNLSAYQDFEDLLNVCVYRLRSAGIPATYEFAHYMGTENGSVGYPVYYNYDDQLIVDKYYNDYSGKVAKIFRKIPIEDSLCVNPFIRIKSLGVQEQDIPLSLYLPQSVDVTQERTRTKDLHFDLIDTADARNNVLYISVWNDNDWKIIYYGEVDKIKKNVSFKDMGTGLLYMVVDHNKKTISSLPNPFIVDSTGNILSLNSRMSEFNDISISKVSDASDILPGRHYDLYIWDKEKRGWKLLLTTVDEKGKLIAKKTPADCLLRLQEKGTNSSSRPFTIVNGAQNFW